MNSKDENKLNTLNNSSNQSTSNNSERFSLATDQTSTLQIENDVDYLRVSEGAENEVLSNHEALISAPGLVDITANITSTILGALGVPVLGTIVKLYSKLFGFLWGATPGQDPWKELMDRVEILIEQKLTEYARSKALAELEGLQNIMKSYVDALESWQNNSRNSQARLLVQQRFVVADSHFKKAMPSFAIKNYEVSLLPVYAQAANLHLLLLRDSQIFGKEWGMPQNEIDIFYNEQLNSLEKYSDHCVEWYHTGLNQLKDKGSSAKNWVDYNRYRREMTLAVLDIVALLPNYDIYMYPMPVHAELTREIYTDPVGSYLPYKGNFYDVMSWYEMTKAYRQPTFQELENLIRKPSRFTWIDNLQMYTRKRQSSQYEYYNYWVGLVLKQSLISASEPNVIITSGEITSEKDRFDFSFYGPLPIYKVICNYIGRYESSLVGVNQVEFYYLVNNTPEKQEYKKDIVVMQQSQKTIDSTEELNNHTLSFIESFDLYWNNKNEKGGTIPIFGWTHHSVAPKNIIFEDKITQVPVIKSNDGTQSEVIQGPGYTGGNLIRGSRYMGNLTITPPSSKYGKKYRMRIRYAADSDGLLEVQIHKNRSTYQMPFKATMKKGEAFKFNSFQYVEKEVTLETFHAGIFLNAHNGLYLDKIEFIPM
ncbi:MULTISPECIES: insecticidal delta-endotoxin Cry8Ea1 family protein [Bacillus cereus group]|uniref:Crystaline entomocidal protoxin n=1 Tax=Bacillus cereus TaxID=1396 RepID=A0A223HH91_BACCE|nr:insecticidal delta-endotoxin Cry8Ea1 family protein [Bacillus cereus]AST51780.1 cry-like protein [Bacillus cereus]KAB2393475.1 delta endotoxin central region subgroup 1 [Bacillus cereus]KAB2407422.1 delta endotoxin central region subgroup 1 [Bacillus cereus]KAB2428580.1 delta endotoxin central region subgroup 1 [Bacillus cereus]